MFFDDVYGKTTIYLPRFKMGLFECTEDLEACLLSCYIPGVAAGMIADKIDQNVPLWGFLGCFFPTVAAIILRKFVRETQNIKVGLFL